MPKSPQYEVRYVEKRKPLDSMPPVVQSLPIFAEDDADARKKADNIINRLSTDRRVELVGLREVVYRDVSLK